MARLHRPGARAAISAARRLRPPALRLADLPWGRIASFAVLFGAISIVLYSRIDVQAVHQQAARFNGLLAFALLLVLPLAGFPVSVLHVAAGVRFGAGAGLAIVSLSILCQVLVSYLIVRVWRHRFERAKWVQKVRERVPEGAHASVCIFTLLLPGAPFAAVNYVLPIIGVPLRTFVTFAWPMHSLRSTVTVVFGDQSDHITFARVAVLLAYALTIAGASWWTYRRLQSRFEDPPPVAGDRKQPV